MPEFSQPFSGNKCNKTLNKNELIRAVRYSIAAEFEAIQLYEQLRDSIEDEAAGKLLTEVSRDEKKHVGNFLHLLKILAPDEEKFYKEGREEAIDVMEIKDSE